MRGLVLPLLFHLCASTPRPRPGPACSGKVPVANQSSPTGQGDCPGLLQVHNASCSIERHGPWTGLPISYHIGSSCHGENDPNGPFFSQEHGVYHLFFQDHVPMQVGGHVATKDFVHWKRLPVAIWNDQWYDKAAIWTFSTTLVDNQPRIVYPGIAGPNASLGDCGHGPDGQGCFTHAIAVPANESDPWLIDWVKPSINPIVTDQINGGSRDPSTAWRTAAGEWRYVDAKADIYSTWDWERFSRVGSLIDLSSGDCPDFYPLPRECEGCGGGAEVGLRPTHVAAATHYTLGVYTDGAENTTGNFTPLVPPTKPGGHAPPTGPLDGSTPKLYYAAKSFEDVTSAGVKRRIVWGWIRLGETSLEISDASGKVYTGFHPGGCDSTGVLQTNVNSLPREVTYDPALQQLLFFPLPELAALRGKSLGTVKSPTKIKAGERLSIGSEKGQWLRSELQVEFKLPLAKGASVGVELRGGLRADGTRFAVSIYAGGFVGLEGVSGYNTSSSMCPLYCRNCPTSVPADRNNRTKCPEASLPLQLKASDKTLTLSVWTDGPFVEAFWMAGRAAWTVPLPCEAIEHGGGAAAFAEGGNAVLESASAWEVEPLSVENVGDEAERT